MQKEKLQFVIKCLSNKNVIILIFGSTIICLTSYFGKISVPQDLLFWTFSTVAQVFVAIGALLGMVAVFKLQIINNRIENIALSLERSIGYFRGIQYFLPEDILREGNKIIKESHPASEIEMNDLKRIIPKYEALFTEKESVRKQIIGFIKNIVVITFFALLFLIVTPLIIKICFGTASLFVIFYLSVLSLISVIKLIEVIL